MSEFTEVTAAKKSEDGRVEKFSLFIKWEGNTPVEFKVVDENNEKPSEDSLFDLELFKEMVESASPIKELI